MKIYLPRDEARHINAEYCGSRPLNAGERVELKELLESYVQRSGSVTAQNLLDNAERFNDFVCCLPLRDLALEGEAQVA